MKLPFRLAIIAMISALLLSGSMLVSVSAEPTLTADQLTKIQSNCTTIKNTMTQVNVNDALLRVNRGQMYESMGAKLMDRFNSRLSNNDITATGFTSITSNYRTTLNTFRSDYQSYEQQLSSALAIDCKKQPTAFANAVDAARIKRSKVHDDVVSLNQYIADYQTSVDTLAASYKQAASGQAN